MNDYTAVGTKVKAMYGKCLNDEDFRALMSKQTVAEVLTYLKNNTSYKKVFKDINENDVHRGAMENLLWKEISDEYERVLHFLEPTKASVLRFWFIRREVDYLKHSIMNIYNNESRLYRFENDEDLDDFFRKQTCINVDICRKAENLKDFADAVKSTVYYDSLIRAESVNADYFSVAMTLDGLYYELFWKSINKNLPKDEQIAMKKYIGSIVDMLNITWIYRGKKYFGFDSKLIYTYILPVRYKIGEEMLTKLVECENAENIKDIMKNMPYKHLFDKVDEGYFIEENYRKLRYGLAKNLFRNHSNSTAGVFAYFILKETEILNITRVIEGIRYAINPDLIKKHIKI